jgi:hypothetical protein
MLGLRGTKSLGARRIRLAESGLTPVFIVVTAGLFLAACQPQQSQLSQGQLRLASAAESAPVAPAPTATPAAAPKPTPLAATPAVAHGETTARLSGDPEELVGLDHTAVRRVLGDPARVRNEMSAQVWQYVTGDCVVDLYLYAAAGGMKVTYVEARSHTAESAPTGRCLKSLLERPTASAQ